MRTGDIGIRRVGMSFVCSAFGKKLRIFLSMLCCLLITSIVASDKIAAKENIIQEFGWDSTMYLGLTIASGKIYAGKPFIAKTVFYSPEISYNSLYREYQLELTGLYYSDGETNKFQPCRIIAEKKLSKRERIVRQQFTLEHAIFGTNVWSLPSEGEFVFNPNKTAGVIVDRQDQLVVPVPGRYNLSSVWKIGVDGGDVVVVSNMREVSVLPDPGVVYENTLKKYENLLDFTVKDNMPARNRPQISADKKQAENPEELILETDF